MRRLRQQRGVTRGLRQHCGGLRGLRQQGGGIRASASSLALALLLLASGLLAGQAPSPGPAGAPPGALPGAPPGAPAAAPPSIDELRQKATAAYADLEAQYRALPQDLFEPAAVLEKAGLDDGALLAWVATETAWLPYEGLLKGPSGTLADRAGSSLDRALLLATLLEAAGHRARLARATLTEAEANALLTRWKPPSAAALAGDCVPPRADGARRVAERAAELEAALAGALGPAAPRETERLAAARDHWWVERAAGDAWKALDPASPEKPLREEAEAHVELARGGERLEAPAHEVDIAIVIEAWEEGKLIERPVVQASVRPCDLGGRRILLYHHAMSGKDALAEPADAALVRKTALAEREWLPVLVAGDRRIASASFDEAGVVRQAPSLSATARLGAAAGGLFGGLAGDVAGEGRESGKPTSSVLTAEWVEVTVRSPGRAPHVVRREVFDLLGPAARAAAAPARPALDDARRLERALILAGSCEWLALTHHLPWAFVRGVLARNELDQRAALLAILGEPDPNRRRALASTLESPGPLYWVAVARRALSPSRGSTYLDAPNLIGFHLRPRLGADGKVGEEAIIDLASCPVATLPGDASLAAAVRQGVADAAAEALALQHAPGAMGGLLDVLELAQSRGLKLVRLKDPRDPALARMGLPPDTLARIGADLASGHLVVLPERSLEVDGRARTGWWRVSAATGETVAVMDTGFHQDQTEEAFLENDTLCGQTLARNRFHRNPFWRRHPGQIARDMGFNPEDMHVLDLILDFQHGLLRLGLL